MVFIQGDDKVAKNQLKPVAKENKLVYSLRDFNYHRNGVSGQGFYYLYFIDTEGAHLHAVIPVFEEDANGMRFEPNQVYVINPLNQEACYRGDRFAAELIPLLKTAIAQKDLDRYGIKTQFAE